MKYVFVIALIVALIFAGMQILEPEFANLYFQDDLHDMATQPTWHSSTSAPMSDEDVRLSVIRSASRHDITLDPKQVTVQRIGQGENQTIYIAVDYTVPVNLLVYSFTLHFSPTSRSGRI
jgi:hypothetical protein